jgi:hypothetical protein
MKVYQLVLWGYDGMEFDHTYFYRQAAEQRLRKLNKGRKEGLWELMEVEVDETKPEPVLR